MIEGNTAWILTSTALVLFMTLPGLALFYGGLVYSKNLISVLIQCFAVAIWSGLVSLLILLILRKFIGIRVSYEEEKVAGLDRSSHSESTYN